MRLSDVSGEVPTRRLAVARGTLHKDGWFELAARQYAETSAVLAAKNAAMLQAALVPFQLTDAFCDVVQSEGGVTVTMTVQGMARTPIGYAALAGASAALLALAGPSGEGRMALEIVQNVQD